LHVDTCKQDRTIVGVSNETTFGRLDVEVTREQGTEALGCELIGATALHNHAAVLAAEVRGPAPRTRFTDAEEASAGL